MEIERETEQGKEDGREGRGPTERDRKRVRGSEPERVRLGHR